MVTSSMEWDGHLLHSLYTYRDISIYISIYIYIKETRGWPPPPFMHKARDGHQNKERLENTAASMRYLLHGMGWPPPPFSICIYRL